MAARHGRPMAAGDLVAFGALQAFACGVRTSTPRRRSRPKWQALAMANWTAADIPDQTGPHVLITGANSGLGLRSAEALAAKGARVAHGVPQRDEGRRRARVGAGRGHRRRAGGA